MKKGKTGVIDIGSNTVRLVIYEHSIERGLAEIQNIKTVARLRTFLTEDMYMTEEGIQRLEKILSSFKEIMEDLGVDQLYATATAAVRQAKNRKEITARMKTVTGIKIDILTEEEEAYFGFLAVAHSLPVLSGVTVDIGGGSTEITYFKEKKLQKSHSFPLGVVSLKQQFMENDRLTPEKRKKLIRFLESEFSTLPWLKDLQLPVIGIGGSARNIAQMDQEAKDYPISGVHQYEMKAADLDEMSRKFENVPAAEMKKIEGLSSDRADIILLAIEVFRVLLRLVNSKDFVFSRKGLREGIMINAIVQTEDHAFNKYDVFSHSYTELTAEYGVNKKHSDFMRKMSADLYNDCCRLGFFQGNEEDELLISRAASLFNLGEYIDTDGASEHTFYLLANRSIDGLFHKDRVRLALVASYKNKELYSRFSRPFNGWFTEEELKKYRDFGALIKFVYGLNVSKREVTKRVELREEEGQLKMCIAFKGNAMAEEYQAERQKKHIERVVKTDLPLIFSYE